MANRVLLGNRTTGGYGLYVSKSGEDVTGAATNILSFASHLSDGQGGVTSMNGEMFNIYSKGYTDITIDQGDMWNTGAITWSRSAFNDGSTDRCPLVFCQVGKASGTSPNTHWLPCMLRQKNNSNDERAGWGYRYKVRPYNTSTTGELEITTFRGATEDGTANNDAAITFRAYYTILKSILS